MSKMGRNPFNSKKAATPPPAAAEPRAKTESQPKTQAAPLEPEEEFDEAEPSTRGVIRNAVLKATVHLPADLFVLAVKTHALIESLLD